jgi:hypothetical protein
MTGLQDSKILPKMRLMLPLLILAGLAAVIFLQRLHTYEEPLERDLTLYAVIGHELLGGRALYADLCENKPPAVFLTYAAAEKLVGYGPGAIFLLGISAALVTLLGVYAAGSALSGSSGTGLWAAFFWTVICSDLTLCANQPNTEVFINACVIWAFALMVKRQDQRSWWWRYLAIGALLALASLYKMVVIGIAVTLALAHLAFPPGDPPDRKTALRQIGVMAVTGAVAWASVSAYFAAAGHFRDFYEIVFKFNRYYAGNILENLEIGLISYAGFLNYAVPLMYLICLESWVFMPKQHRRPWALLLGLAIGTHIAVAIPGKFYPHYFLYWLPPLAVILAWTIEELEGLLTKYSVWIKSLIAIGTVIFIVGHVLPDYQLSADDWSRKKYGEIFSDSKKVGEEISRILEPDETFYAWGAESGLYFYSRRQPAAGVLCCWHLFDFSYAPSLSNRVVEDLEKAQPELFVVGGWSFIKFQSYLLRPNPVLRWFCTRYRPFAMRGPFILFVRQGGKLDARLSQQNAPGEGQAVSRGDEVLHTLRSINLDG